MRAQRRGSVVPGSRESGALGPELPGTRDGERPKSQKTRARAQGWSMSVYVLGVDEWASAPTSAKKG